MKKSLAIPVVLAVSLFGFWKVSHGESAATSFGADPMDSQYQKLAGQADRDKELLEVWKNHVRTLTQERDEAYKRLEALRAAGDEPALPSANLEAVVKERDYAVNRVESLKSAISRLEAENRRLQTQTTLEASSASENEVLRKSYEDLQERYRLQEAKLRELAQQPVQSSIDIPVREMKSLEIENQALKARSEKLDIVEAELKEARTYFASVMDELKAENRNLQAEIQSARSSASELATLRQEVERGRSEKDSALASMREEFKSEASQVEKTLAQVRADKTEALRQVQSLQLELEQARGQREALDKQEKAYRDLEARYRADREEAENQVERLRETADRAYADNETRQKAYENMKEELATLSDQKDAAEREIEKLRTDMDRVAAENEGLRASGDEALKAREEMQRAKQEIENSFRLRMQALESQAEKQKQAAIALREEKAEHLAHIAELESKNNELAEAHAEVSRMRQEASQQIQELETERDAAASQNRQLQDSVNKLKSEVEKAKALQEELLQTRAREDTLKAENQKIKTTSDDLSRQNQDLKKRLDANAADLANLRQNFEELMQPLVSGFEERKK